MIETIKNFNFGLQLFYINTLVDWLLIMTIVFQQLFLITTIPCLSKF